MVGLAGLCCAGCSGWRVAAATPENLDSLPARVRITLESGERVELHRPVLTADSLRGMAKDDSTRLAFHVNDVARVATQGPTPATRTVNLMGGVAAATAGLLFVLAIKGW